MEIDKQIENGTLIIKPHGRIDTVTSEEFKDFINENINLTDKLVFDFEDVPYISSSCLRIVLATQKQFQKFEAFSLINVCPEVRSVFDLSGFSSFLNIK